MTTLNGPLNRRQFIKVVSAGAAAAGGIAEAPAILRQTAPAAHAAPARAAKTVRFAMSGALTSADIADPALSNTQHDGRLMTAVYEQLSRYDESLRAQPWLAESWTPNAKGDVWTFRLRQGVRFHDGSSLTARDVVYSFQRVLDPKTGSPGAAILSFLDPHGIQAVDDLTVRFKLPQPNADLPLTLITKQSYIVKEGSTSADLRTHANGTGAFRLQQFTPGEDPTVFVKNPHYWQSGLPKADVFQLLSISEPASRVAALQRGQVDIIEDPPPTALVGLQGGSSTRVVVQTKGNMEVIAMQMDVPPFTDSRVRLALKYALDRSSMLQLVAQGRGVLVNDIPIASALEFALQGPPRTHNIAKAKALLSEAGYANGLNLKLAVSDVQARFIDFATVYKYMAAAAGINLTLDVRPADSYWDAVWLKVPMFVSAWIARPTDAMLALLFLSKAPSNETHWHNPAWDARFAKARSTLNYQQRKSMYQQLQRQVIDEGGYLDAYMVNTIGATRATVTGWRPSGTFFENFTTIDFTS